MLYKSLGLVLLTPLLALIIYLVISMIIDIPPKKAKEFFIECLLVLYFMECTCVGFYLLFK